MGSFSVQFQYVLCEEVCNMKNKLEIDNGNIEKAYRNKISTDNPNDIYEHSNLNTTQTITKNTNFLYNYNNKSSKESLRIGSTEVERCTVLEEPELICNRLYKLDAQKELKFQNLRNKKVSANLEGVTKIFRTSCESFLVNGNGDRTFDYADAEETSGKGTLPIPRGIVNPNYPGFQHLAHTLQDYNTNIENYYHSENDMTDDDVDYEIADTIDHLDITSRDLRIDNFNINNNNNIFFDTTTFKITESGKTSQVKDSSLEKSNIPDLLKTIKENNNDTIRYDCNCSAIDIENNFNTNDIIGDFNKEVEDEIKQVLNYNINIQDDLEELKKDIKINLSKPIENTINNISDVVNHVIKKLVETQCDYKERIFNVHDAKESSIKEIGSKENEKNISKGMNRNRPTFLFVESNINKNIMDAHLSDAKDEINISEQDFDTDMLSNDVETTIKQLSTELRKIIPKLDELRDRELFFAGNKNDSNLCINIKDDNCNDRVSNPAKILIPRHKKSPIEVISSGTKEYYCPPSMKKTGFSSKNSTRSSRERLSDLSGSSQNSTNLSVQRQVETDLESFDVYNIETALPKLDIDAIESHLKAAKEAERRKRNDREEIRKRLAMGVESEDYYSLGHIDRHGKKPSLQTRLQNGKNLQICFMNETASDNESQTSDVERNFSYSNRNLSKSSIFSKSNYSLNNHPYQTRPLSVSISKHDKIGTVKSVPGAKLKPSSLSTLSTKSKSRSAQSLSHMELKESDFNALQATLQTEARIALAQAKEMARIEMERERRGRAVSPVTEMLRRSTEKARVPLAADRRRLSRHLLTDLNVAQLQVIVNELHSQIEGLNEGLVRLLMARDELHMGQDSMLVDIEDLTRYLGVKEQTKKTKGNSKSAVRRLTSYIQK